MKSVTVDFDHLDDLLKKLMSEKKEDTVIEVNDFLCDAVKQFYITTIDPEVKVLIIIKDHKQLSIKMQDDNER